MAKPHKPDRPPIERGGDFDIPVGRAAAPVESVNDEARTFTVVFTTGAPVDRVDWWTGERYVEELIVSGNAIRLGRLNAGAAFLDSHRAYGGVSAQFGVVERAWIEGGVGKAEIRFPKAEDDPDADRVFRKIKDKILRNVSVGYRRMKVEVDERKNPKVWRVVDWEPFEISIVTVPADAGAQVRAADDPSQTCHFVRADAADDVERLRIAARMRMRQAGLAR